MSRSLSPPPSATGAAGRIAVLLSLCCALLTPAATAGGAAAGPAQGQIVPGKAVGEIRVGMAVGELLRLWGPPARIEPNPEGVSLYDYGDAQGVGVFVSGDRVVQILVVSPQWITTNGLAVGATRPEVVAFFGRPDEEVRGQSVGESRWLYRQRGIVFIFQDRAVAGITVVAAETPEAPEGLDPDDPALRKPFRPTPGGTRGSRP